MGRPQSEETKHKLRDIAREAYLHQVSEGLDDRYSADLQLIQKEYGITTKTNAIHFAIAAEAERIREERIAEAKSKRKIAALAKKGKGNIKGEGVQKSESEIARELLARIKQQEGQSA